MVGDIVRRSVANNAGWIPAHAFARLSRNAARSGSDASQRAQTFTPVPPRGKARPLAKLIRCRKTRHELNLLSREPPDGRSCTRAKRNPSHALICTKRPPNLTSIPLGSAIAPLSEAR